MILKILIACLLVIVTVVVHALGFHALLRSIMRRVLSTSGFGPVTRMVIHLAISLILIHLTEIAVWGMFYLWQGCLPDLESAFYFSGVTYTTVGYGDIVLPKPWRLFAPIEAMTGILMCGLSTGLFFALVSRWISQWMKISSAATHDADHARRAE